MQCRNTTHEANQFIRIEERMLDVFFQYSIDRLALFTIKNIDTIPQSSAENH